jgi:thiopurine S-methyltransferase
MPRMEQEFWRQKWETQDTPGFDQTRPNPLLIDAYTGWGPEPGARVFVPLCGKSVDMRWLEDRGHSVLGVELVESAVLRYFSGSQTQCRSFDAGQGLKSYRADQTEIFAGDFFDINPDWVQDCLACYDRASLVALPFEMRKDYAAHLTRLLPAGCKMLLMNFEYDDSKVTGPPFSVPRAEISDLYSQDFEITEILRGEVVPKNPKFASAGLKLIEEAAFLLIRK